MSLSMQRTDFRSTGRDPEEELRARAVYLILERGHSQTTAADAIGVARLTVNRLMKRHAKSGEAGLKDGRRISSHKGGDLLTAAEAARMQGWATDKGPDQLKLPYMRWTSGNVWELIYRRLGKFLGLTTVQRHADRWGFTQQKPLTRATRRSEAAIALWMKQEYPEIARWAKREGALNQPCSLRF